MADQRIVALCSKGKNFNAQARVANALSIGDVYYVDFTTSLGSNADTGEDWEHAMATIDGALDMCTAGKNDYIIARGPHDTAIATATTLDTIDVDGVHVIGFSGALNPYTPGYAQRRRSTAADLPVVLITADDVEYAGWEVQGQMDAGAWSAAQPKAPLRVGSTLAGNERLYMHNVSVRDPGYAAMTGAIALVNCHYPVLEQVSIRSVGNIDYGLQLLPGVGPMAQMILKDSIIGGTRLGLMATGIDLSFSSAQNLSGAIMDNLWFPRVTQCIDFGIDYDAWALLTNFTSSATVATSFVGTTACANKAALVTNYEITSHGWCRDGVWA